MVLRRRFVEPASRSVPLGLVGSCLLALTAPAEAQFSVSPVIVQVAATEVAPARLQVRNEGENGLQFRAYALDFDMSPSGDHAYWEHGTQKQSCGQRLRIAPDAFTVPAGQSETISVSLDPGDSDTTCWSMVLVETSGSSEGSVVVRQRIGVKFYGLSADADVDGEVLAAGVDRDSIGLDVGFSVRNRGSWPLRPTGTLEIRDVHGQVVASQPVEAFSVLPEREREIRVVIPEARLEPGRYLAVPILDFGAEYLAGTQIDFRIEE